jgi:hypothetical protein
MTRPDDENEPLTRFLGTPATPSAPPREPMLKARGKTRLVIVVVLAFACLGAGTWLMR